MNSKLNSSTSVNDSNIGNNNMIDEIDDSSIVSSKNCSIINNVDLNEIGNSNEKSCQVGESFIRAKPPNKVNLVSISKPRKSAKDSPKTQEISPSQCIFILLNSFMNVLSHLSLEICLFFGFMSFVIFGNNGMFMFIFLLMSYRLLSLYQSQDMGKSYDPNDKICSMFDNLNIPAINKVKYKRKLKQLANRRKPYYLRSSGESSSETENEQELEVEVPDFSGEIEENVKFTVKAKVGETNFNLEIDSGSSISIITESVLKTIPEENILYEYPAQGSYIDFSGNKIPFTKKIQLYFKIQHASFKHIFHVTSCNQASNLLGADMIVGKRLSLEVNGQNKVFLTFYHAETDTKQKLLVNEEDEHVLTVSNTTLIKGGGTTLINAKLSSNTRINFVNRAQLYNSVGLATTNLNDFSVDKQFITAVDIDGSITVPIANKTLGDSYLFEGQKLGSFKFLPPGYNIINFQDNSMETVGKNYKVESSVESVINSLKGKLQEKKEKTVCKVKLTNSEDDKSSDFNEDNLEFDSLNPPRATDSKKTWEEVLQNVPERLQKRVFDLLTNKYQSVVSKSSTDIGDCTLEDSEFPITLEDNLPFSCKPYPLNSVFGEQLDEIISDMIKAGLMSPGTSNYTSGIFIRSRPDHTNSGQVRIRAISDYRRLNAKSVSDVYPLPNIKNLLQKLHSSKFFILLDLKDSYMSIRIKEQDQHKAALITHKGVYLPKRMQYGFKNAPSHFSRVLGRAISGLESVCSYLDDIIIMGDSEESCIDTLELVLERLSRFNFRISLNKLKIFGKYLKILGFKISKSGIQSDPAKTSAIQDLPLPTTKQQLQKFLGSVNFHSEFIPNYALIAGPLYKYTGQQEEKIELDEEACSAFQKLKELVVKPVILAFVDPTKEIFLETDASNFGFGSFAYQVTEYNIADIPKLQAEHAEMLNKTTQELNEELARIIDCYVSGEEIPPYDPLEKPSRGTSVDENMFEPYANYPTKIRKYKDKIYVPRIVFFHSHKFGEPQIRAWSSLMKELSAIIATVEKKCDILALAKNTIILTDCKAAVYLYEQAKSNSLMARYLSRLNSYSFTILVRHKAGEHLLVADSLSRYWIIDQTEEKNAKVSHMGGILVKVPFYPGEVVTPQRLIEYILSGEDQIVMSSNDPKISKMTDTGDLPNMFEYPKDIKINQVQPMKTKILEEVKTMLDDDLYRECQQKEFSEIFTAVLTKQNTEYKVENGFILTKNQKGQLVRYTPTKLRNLVLSKCHLYGHYAGEKMYQIISQTDFWPGLRRDCKNFAQTCLACIWLHPPTGAKYALGYQLTGRVGEVYQLDVVSGLQNVKGFSFFCSLIDSASRFTITFPLRTDTSVEISRNLEQRLLAVFGSPKFIITDGAQNLSKSNTMQELCNLYKVQLKIRTPYSSRSLGLCERVHRTILDNMRALSDSFENSWLDNLDLATAIYNAIPHTALKLSPYELYFGKRNPLFDPLSEPNVKVTNPDLKKYYLDLKDKLASSYEQALKNDLKYKREMRKKFGGKTITYEVGQFVLAQNKTPALNEKRKLRKKWYGPFLIREVLTTVLVVESVLTNKVSYLNKNLVKRIPEKSMQKYNDLPIFAKIKFGSGFTYDYWMNLHNNNQLKAMVNKRNFMDTEYGIEYPATDNEPFIETLHAEEEFFQPPSNVKDTSSSNEEVEIPDANPLRKKVTFDSNLPRRSNRNRRSPNRLDL